MTVDCIIPVYGPTGDFERLLYMLSIQTLPPGRVIIMNTEKPLWEEWMKKYGRIPENLTVEVHHLTKEEFDHGGTRDRAMGYSDADVCVLLTQDAMPMNEFLLRKMVEPLESDDDIAVVYGRQHASAESDDIEVVSREFNYPPISRKKGIADLNELGIKTFFCSNVCAAYRRNAYIELGGFVHPTIFNEDMIFASKAVKAGYSIYYQADAGVVHSHVTSASWQFKRYFDLGVSQADHPEVFSGVSSESEGMALVKKTIERVVKKGRPWKIIQIVWVNAAKLTGYRLGKLYKNLPDFVIKACTSNKYYWK